MVRHASYLGLHEVQVVNKAAMAPWRARWTKILIDPIYVGVPILVNIAFTVFLVSVDRMKNLWHDNYLTGIYVIATIMNLFFIFEMLANFIVLGFKNVFKNKFVIVYELLL